MNVFSEPSILIFFLVGTITGTQKLKKNAFKPEKQRKIDILDLTMWMFCV